MKILVLLKEVPVVSNIQIDRQTLKIDRSGAGKMMNISDRHAIEAALATAEATGASVTAMTMGPESSESLLRDAIGMGCSDAVRITDNAFAGADTLVTANVIKAAADQSGPYEVIFTGESSVDGETGQIPGKLSAMYGYALLTHACSVEADAQGLTIERKAGTGYEKLAASWPLVCSITEDANTPRGIGLKGKKAMKSAQIPVLTNAELGLGEDALASPSKVTGLVPPPTAEVGNMLTGADDVESAGNLVQTLIQKQLV